MRPEKLECLFDSFIANRTRYADVPDGVLQCSDNHAVEIQPPDFGMLAASGQPHWSMQDAVGQLPHFNIYEAHAGVQAQPQAPAELAQQDRIINMGRQLVEAADEFAMSLPDRSIVKFERSCIVVAPKEQITSVIVKRSSASANTVTKVTWRTCDRTAISGTHYVQSSGEIVFELGVLEKTIEIKILQSSGDNLHFNVKMSVVDDGFDPRPMTVTLKNLDKLYENERQVVENLSSLSSFSVADVRSILSDCLNIRTFLMGLTHLCSAADSVHVEFALAFDLGQMCIRHLPRSSILRVFEDYFGMDDIDF